MASEIAPQRGPGADAERSERGQLLFFPERRAFGPFSWRTVRIASFAILVLILSGALLEMFFGQSLREHPPESPNASRVPS